ncbi:MAG: protein kinase, partial [Planctomycetota bacterium]|nr:protein kinase [Planctomycetota bacterium]
SSEFGKPGPPSDVWSFGVLLYYCLSNEMPFKADSVYKYCIAVLESDPAPLKVLDKNCPRQLSNLVKDCLSKDPRDRPTMADIGERLDGSLMSLRRQQSQSPMKWRFALIAVAFLALGVLFFLNQDNVAPNVVWDKRPKSFFGADTVLSGGVTEPDCVLLIDRKRVPIENSRFHVTVPLTVEGKSIPVELTDGAGNVYKDKVFLKRSASVTVSKEGREGGFQSIGEALKASPKEVIIEVEPGEYVESIVLKEGRTIVASSSSKPVVWRSKKGPCLLLKRGETLLRGLTFRGKNKDRALVIESGQVTLETVNLSAQGDIGISVTGNNSLLQAKDC